jgi:ATP-dependent RNA helicase MSS116, mitochondrial
MQRIDYKYMGSVVLLGLIHCLITDNPFNHAQMSFVQAAVLPLLSELACPYDGQQSHGPPCDLLVKAKTGTGKTLAFLISAIEA